MKHFTVLTIILLFSITLFSFETDGMIRNYSGIFIENRETAVFENTFKVNLYDHSPLHSAIAEIFLHQSPGIYEFNMRQLYGSVNSGSFTLTGGKFLDQWAYSRELRITDIVGPIDLSDFLIPGFDEIREGVTMFMISAGNNEHKADIIYVPQFESNTAPAEDSPWTPAQANDKTIIMRQAEGIENNFNDYEVFARYRYTMSSLETGFIGGFNFNDSPYQAREMFPDSLLITPVFERHISIGANTRYKMPGKSLFAEVLYQHNIMTESSLPDSIFLEHASSIDYVLGLNHSVMGFNYTLQFHQSIIPFYRDTYISEQFYNFGIIQMSKKAGKFKFVIKSLIEMNENINTLLHPQIFFIPSKNTIMKAGSYIFTGSTGKYGQFNKNDFAYIKLIYNF